MEEAENLERLVRINYALATRLARRARDHYSESYDRFYERYERGFEEDSNNLLLRRMYDYTAIVRSNYYVADYNINRIVRAIRTRLPVTNGAGQIVHGRQTYNPDNGWPIPRPGEIDLIRRQVHQLIFNGIIPQRDPRGIGVVDSDYNDSADDWMYELINDIIYYILPSQVRRNIDVDGFNFRVVPNHYQSYRVSVRSRTEKMWEEHFVDWLVEVRFGPHRSTYSRTDYILN